MDPNPFLSEQRFEAEGRVAVLVPRGVLNGHPACYAWLESARQGIRDGHRRIVLNLGDVTRIDSTGIGIIAALCVSATNVAGTLCLTGLSDRTRRLLETTFLLRVIPSFDTESEAVRAACADAS